MMMKRLSLFSLFTLLCCVHVLAEGVNWHGTWHGYTHLKEKVTIADDKWVRADVPVEGMDPVPPLTEHVRETLGPKTYLLEDDRGGNFRIVKLFVEGEGEETGVTVAELGLGTTVKEAKAEMEKGKSRSDDYLKLMGLELWTESVFQKMEALPSVDTIPLEKLLETMQWEQDVKDEIDNFLSWQNELGELNSARRRAMRIVRAHSERKMLELGYNPFKQEGPPIQRRFGADPTFRERTMSLMSYLQGWKP